MRSLGDELEGVQIDGMKERLSIFKKNLEAFAKHHKKEINRNPEFRHYFAKMCNKIGVDPLASSKGFWAELLGVGDFYYEIGIQLAAICFSKRKQNGGIMELEECVRLLKEKRKHVNKNLNIGIDDVKQAISKMRVLGNGFQILTLNGKLYVQSVPYELNEDSTAILEKVENLKGGIKISKLMSSLGWKSKEKVENGLEVLLNEGICWVDEQEKGEPSYWFPGMLFRKKAKGKGKGKRK